MEASVATAGQGAPSGGVQDAAASQGAPAGQSTATQQGDGFNWGNFPDVPEAQRELLAPHLTNIQGHVTRMEQASAPYKGLMGMVGPDEVENLVGFLNGFSNDPVATTLGMLRSEIEGGKITQEQVQELFGGQQTLAPGQQAQPAATETEQVPEWAKALQARFEQEDAQKAQDEQARQQAELDQTWETAKTNIRAQLTQSGIPDTLISEEMLQAAVIATNGDEAAAIAMFSQLRDGFLGEFTNDKTRPGGQPRVRGDVPKPAAKPQRRGDGFDDARTGAKQLLERAKAQAGGG